MEGLREAPPRPCTTSHFRPRTVRVLDRYSRCERWSPPLIRTTVVSLVLLLLALIGLMFDDRVILGAPAMLKPAKFAASGAVYLFTLAWMIRDLPKSRALRAAAAVIGWIIVMETVLIFAQAVRGLPSHFNVDTPLNIAIFSSMGFGIATVWVLSMLILIWHVRTPAADRAMATALRVGLALNIVGAGVGWRMTQPSAAQIASMSRSERPFVAGAHSVGGGDGEVGMPITHWSRHFGDLRIPHFLGMHALQLLPLLLLGIRRVRQPRNDGAEHAFVLVTAALCITVFGAALIQALNGHPLIPPSSRTL